MRVADLPPDRQAQLVLRRALARIETRRGEIDESHRFNPGVTPDYYRNWPLRLPDPRWVVALIVHAANRRARGFTLDDAGCREITDAILVVLALEAT